MAFLSHQSEAAFINQKPLSLCFSCIQVVDELKINELELEVCSHFEKRVVTGLHDSISESMLFCFGAFSSRVGGEEELCISNGFSWLKMSANIKDRLIIESYAFVNGQV